MGYARERDIDEQRPEEDDASDRRAYFRVVTRIPLRWRSVDRGEFEELATQIRARSQPDPGTLDASLAAWLDRIERKLDRVLAQLGAAEHPLFGPDDVQDVTVSGSGMRFTATADIERGVTVFLDFELGERPVQRVCALGTVVASRPKTAGATHVAVEFREISASDRDAIVRHAVEVQRRELRTRNATESELS